MECGPPDVEVDLRLHVKVWSKRTHSILFNSCHFIVRHWHQHLLYIYIYVPKLNLSLPSINKDNITDPQSDWKVVDVCCSSSPCNDAALLHALVLLRVLYQSDSKICCYSEIQSQTLGQVYNVRVDLMTHIGTVWFSFDTNTNTIANMNRPTLVYQSRRC